MMRSMLLSFKPCFLVFLTSLCLNCLLDMIWNRFKMRFDIFKLQALSEHHHLCWYRSCHLLNCVSIIWNVAKFLWLAIKGNSLVIDDYHDKLLGHWQKHFSDKNWLNGILLHMFLISHMGIKFLSFCMLKVALQD